MNRKYTPHLLLLLLLGLLSYYFYSETISLFPSFIHAWTQSDRYALALAFLDNGMNLFLPATFNLQTVDGITGVDLPWHEYIIAVIMKISGSEAPVIFRLYTLLYSWLGYFFLFRLSNLMGLKTPLALSVVAFVFTLPVLSYYQAGFVPSSPALSTSFIGLYYFFNYLKNGRRSHFYLAIGLITTAALYRMPFNILLFAVVLLMVFRWFKARKLEISEGLGLLLAYVLIIGYQLYKNYLNSTYGSMFLTELMPAENMGEFFSILAEVKQRWQWEYFTKGHYLVLILTFIGLAWQAVRGSKLEEMQFWMGGISMLLLGGGSLYFILMAQQFPAHDYYFIDSLYPGVILLLVFTLSLKFKNGERQLLGLALLLPTLTLATIESRDLQQRRYTFGFWDRGEITRQNFEGAASFLDNLQIPSDARVLVLDAYSTNAPLILMDRKGYTVQNTTKENLQKGLAYPYDYIVVQDVFLPSDVIFNYPELANHLKRVAGNGKISVYTYSEEAVKQNIYSLLGVTSSFKAFPLELGSPEWERPLWKYDMDTVREQPSRELVGLMGPQHQFGPVFNLEKDPAMDKLLFNAQFRHPAEEVRFEAVCTIMEGDRQLFYRSFPVHLKKAGEWQEYFCLFDLPEDLNDNIQLKCNLYNSNGATVEMKNVQLVMY